MRVPSITDIVREYIEKSIYAGKFKPGSKVTEAEIGGGVKNQPAADSRGV